TERISVIEPNREITAFELRKYLPEAEATHLPVLVPKQEDQKMFNNEREILYQVLFDMKKDVNDLKKLVHEIMSGNVAVSQEQSYTPASTNMHHAPAPIHSQPIHSQPIHHIEEPEEYVEESLSLEDVEKEMIKKALERHGGKRKNAANDLKISERTLYRKIKEYNLD
ncbi:MAG: helix-turn-helix domain-containing protein, partial [Tannerellaceae bacterium]